MDNRLKTLFDALSIPCGERHIAKHRQDGAVLCLLEDDSLITGFSVQTDRLLSPPQSVNDVKLIIEVTVHLACFSELNVGFLGDWG